MDNFDFVKHYRSFNNTNLIDANGNPGGGEFSVQLEDSGELCLWGRWQNGPVIETGDLNGVGVENLLCIARNRLQFYQGELPDAYDGRFACEETAEAISHINNALAAIASRVKRRVAAGTMGKNEGK